MRSRKVEVLAEIRKMAVLRAGLMGHGIAQVAARTGKCEVNLRDTEQRFIDGETKMIGEGLGRSIREASGNGV